MTKSIKKVLMTVFCFTLAVCAFVCVYTITSAHATSSIISMDSVAQANLLSEKKSGLRFRANLDANEFETLLETHGTENVKAGMMILPTDLVEDAERKDIKFTVSGIGAYEYNGKALSTQFAYYDYAKTYKEDSDNNAYYFYMTMPDIAEKNYNRDFTAKAFIEVTADSAPSAEFNEENGKYYSYTATTTTANVYEVAYEAYIQTEEDKALLEEEKEIAVKFLDNVAVLEYADGEVKIANTIAGVYESPYVIEKDGLGNYVLGADGKTPLALTYNESRYANLTLKDTSNNVAINTMLSKGATFGENNSVTLDGKCVDGAGHLYQIVDIDNSYIAFKGDYGVGTYVDFEFTGPNMPLVMFFADEINGNMTNYSSSHDKSTGEIADYTGILFSNGMWNPSKTNNTLWENYTIWGPNRIYRGTNVVTGTIGTGSALCATTTEAFTLFGQINSYSTTNFKYVVGTQDKCGKLSLHSLLYDNDTGVLIAEFHNDTDLDSNDYSGSIIAYATLNGEQITEGGTTYNRGIDSTFEYSMPYTQSVLEGSQISHAAGRLYSVSTLENDYISFEGDYGVGTCIDFEFVGNNLPQVMLFTDNVDGMMAGFTYTSAPTASTEPTITKGVQGILLSNGFFNSPTSNVNNGGKHAFAIWGPNRFCPSDIYSPVNAQFGDSLFAQQINGSKYGTRSANTEIEGDVNASVLSQTTLGESYSNQKFKYSVTTNVNSNGILLINITLSTINDNDKVEQLVNIDCDTGLDASTISGNIMVFASVKGTGNPTIFKTSGPYQSLLKGGTVVENEDGSVTLNGCGLESKSGAGFAAYVASLSNSFIAFDGDYGVGTYVDFTFTGNNLPQVMLFADKINDNMAGFTFTGSNASAVLTATGEKGILLTNGFFNNPTSNVNNGGKHSFAIWGPNRYLPTALNDAYSSFLSGSLFASTTSTAKAGTRKDNTTVTGVNASVLSQTTLGESYSDQKFKYVVGSYSSENNTIVVEVLLYTVNDGTVSDTPLIQIECDTGVATEDMKGSIIVYASCKGDNTTTTFAYRQPYTKTN